MVTTNDAMFREVSVLFFFHLFILYQISRVLISMLIAQHGAAEAVPGGDSGNNGKGRQ